MQKGKLMAEKNNFKQTLSGIYDNYGVLKEMQMQYDSADIFYNKSLALKTKFKDSVGIAYSLNNIAGLYLLQKQFSKAKFLYNKALKIRLMKRDANGILESYLSLGDLYFEKKDYKTSLFYFQKVLHQAKKLKMAYLITAAYMKISENYESLGDATEALKYYKLYEQSNGETINKETNSKIAELEVKFDTNNKEKELFAETLLSVFPNPTKDFITINSNSKITSISVYDVAGKLMQNGISFTNNQLNLSSLPAGIYLVKINLEDRSDVIKR